MALMFAMAANVCITTEWTSGKQHAVRVGAHHVEYLELHFEHCCRHTQTGWCPATPHQGTSVHTETKMFLSPSTAKQL